MHRPEKEAAADTGGGEGGDEEESEEDWEEVEGKVSSSVLRTV